VTQGGMDELLNENKELISEKRILLMKMKGDLLNYINAKLQLLNNRIATAKIVDLNNQPMMKYDLVRWLL
jgi:transcription elongation factor GreB